jgi:hypothetical protein
VRHNDSSKSKITKSFVRLEKQEQQRVQLKNPSSGQIQASKIGNEKRPVGRHSAKSLPDHPSLQVTETTSPVLPEIDSGPA